MNMRIAFEGLVPPEDSIELGILAEDLRREELPVTKEEGPVPRGQKDTTLIVALVVAGLAGLRTLLSVVSMWQSSRPKYSVSVTRGGVSFSIGNLSAKQLEQVAAQLHAQQESSDVVVRITRT